ncbi:cytochrome c-type biogenesis protein [Sphaerotilus mobilis]|uniref:Cytochrome c-type biogenesis protein n=1 Tax=Sphaerotilus mobilis TaxID=47994 RepID=A0A4V2EX46_9BURK|nr:cytochrome c-type biogenesis protein [Sphaerotilus mobilis]RZS58220.1 cytochrome c-type biogenesis protein CcmH [Sphaerotilus mobilis]
MSDHLDLPTNLWRLIRRVPALLASVFVAVSLLAPAVQAAEAQPAVADPELERRMLEITSELRCLVCQNQTVAGSSAGLADDLREQVREMLHKGASNEEIISFMTARYGDFVLYRPPVKTTTVLLWAGPTVLMIGGVAMLIVVLRRRSRMPAEAFDPDEDEDSAATGRT